MPRPRDFPFGAEPARYKGRAKTERDYPHVVELIVPLKGFGNTLNKMQTWHEVRELEQCQGSVHFAEPHWYCQWRFADPKDAKEFQAAFGGQSIRL